MRDTARFLRLKARQCRSMAAYHVGEARASLLRMAREADEAAARLSQPGAVARESGCDVPGA